MRNDHARSRPVIGIDLDAVTVFDTGEVRRRGPVTDGTLGVVADFGQLEELSLDGADVTDLGMVSLLGLKELRRLNVAHTRVTDRGLELLKGLSKLTFVDLRGTSVTAAGVAKLQRDLPNVQVYDDSEKPAASAVDAAPPGCSGRIPADRRNLRCDRRNRRTWRNRLASHAQIKAIDALRRLRR